MKITTKTVIAAIATLTLSIAACSGMKDENMSKNSDGTYVVNTTKLCADVRGFKDATPLLVYIKNDKIVKVEPLANKETPEYFNSLRGKYLSQWDGMQVKTAAEADVDAYTGATYSSNAVIANVQTACQYYLKKK